MLTPEQEKNIINDYYDTKSSLEQIAHNYGVSLSYLNKFLQTRIQKRFRLDHPYRKFSFNEKIFDTIDTEAKSYFLGLLMADGCIKKNSISLGLIDLEMIEEFKGFLSATNEITCRPAKDNSKDFYQLQVFSKLFIQKISNLGLVMKKSTRTKIPEQIPSHLIHHFIRGYFDGDGNWATNKNKKGFRITSCSYGVLNQIQDILIHHKIMRPHNWIRKDLREKGNHITYFLDIGAKYDLIRFGDFIYKDSTIFLDRKRIIFEKAKIQISKNDKNKLSKTKSGFWGVSYVTIPHKKKDKEYKIWQVLIIKNKNVLYRNRFLKAKDAALAYNQKIIELGLEAERPLNILD